MRLNRRQQMPDRFARQFLFGAVLRIAAAGPLVAFLSPAPLSAGDPMSPERLAVARELGDGYRLKGKPAVVKPGDDRALQFRKSVDPKVASLGKLLAEREALRSRINEKQLEIQPLMVADARQIQFEILKSGFRQFASDRSTPEEMRDIAKGVTN